MRLRIFGIPLHISPAFFLVAAFLGWNGAFVRVPGGFQFRLDRLLVWIVIVVVSVVAHELGHALTARRHGADVAMRLYALGGLTAWSVEDEDLTPGRRAFIAAAGSGVGLILGGLAYLLWQTGAVHPGSGLAAFAVRNFIWVNVFWGLINWLPIRPLDGGHIFSSLMEALFPRSGERIADAVFLATAMVGTLLAFTNGLFFAGILGVWLLMGEFQLRSERRGSGRPQPPPMDPGSSFLFDPPEQAEPRDGEPDPV